MTNRERFLAALSPDRPLCDDCLTAKAGFRARQVACQIGTELATAGRISRARADCASCRRYKIGNWGLRSAPTRTAPPPATVSPAAAASPVARPWYWEGNVQAVLARQRLGVGVEQRHGQLRERRPCGQRSGEVAPRQRMFFHREVVQVGARRGHGTPRLPGQQEIEAGAEPELADTEVRVRVASPTARQVIAFEEHMAAFGETVVPRVVHILEHRGDRRSALAPVHGDGPRVPGGDRRLLAADHARSIRVTARRFPPLIGWVA